MDVCPPGFMPISDAYETIVQTLEPDARPGDDYLDKLLKDQGDDAFTAAFDKAVEAEKRAERLLADALANKQLARWICVDGNMLHRHVRKTWEPDPSCPGLDAGLPDFTVSGDRDGNMVFVEERELILWINSQLTGVTVARPTQETKPTKENKLAEELQRRYPHGRPSKTIPERGAEFCGGEIGGISARACPHLSQAKAQTKCRPARKLRAVFS
jgi:hypothetical protein